MPRFVGCDSQKHTQKRGNYTNGLSSWDASKEQWKHLPKMHLIKVTTQKIQGTQGTHQNKTYSFKKWTRYFIKKMKYKWPTDTWRDNQKILSLFSNLHDQRQYSANFTEEHRLLVKQMKNPLLQSLQSGYPSTQEHVNDTISCLENDHKFYFHLCWWITERNCEEDEVW